jgi:hypothetical protein
MLADGDAYVAPGFKIQGHFISPELVKGKQHTVYGNFFKRARAVQTLQSKARRSKPCIFRYSDLPNIPKVRPCQYTQSQLPTESPLLIFIMQRNLGSKHSGSEKYVKSFIRHGLMIFHAGGRIAIPLGK